MARNFSIFGSSWQARKWRKIWRWKFYFSRKYRRRYNHGTRIF